MKRFECVDDQKAAGFPVIAACEAAGVSTSGYYDRQQREAAGPTEHQLAEAELVALMRQLFDDADGNYGVPRMVKSLRKAGLVVNKKRVVRLMRLHGMAGRFRRRKCRTTFPGPDGYHIPDLVGRGFAPGQPDVAWCQDITYSAQLAVMRSDGRRAPLSGWFAAREAAHNQSCSRKARSRSGGRNLRGPGL